MRSTEQKQRLLKWAQALRSGTYKQTTGRLRSQEGFCCLGVACDLYAEEGNVRWAVPLRSIRPLRFGFGSRFNFPPAYVAEWYGLEDAGTDSIDTADQGFQYDLARLNDSGATFEQIAEKIEKYAESE